MGRAEEAVELFDQGHCCSQAVLAVFSEELELSKKNAFKVASGFGGGMRMAETCGAVTGAFMVLGRKFGPDKENVHLRVEELIKKFKMINGSINCRELMGCDITTKVGMDMAREKNLFDTTCVKLIRDAAEILEEMVL